MRTISFAYTKDNILALGVFQSQTHSEEPHHGTTDQNGAMGPDRTVLWLIQSHIHPKLQSLVPTTPTPLVVANTNFSYVSVPQRQRGAR